MKRLHVILVVIGGLAARWLLPSPGASGEQGLRESSKEESTHIERTRARAKQEYLEVLLDFQEIERMKIDSAASLSELLAALRDENHVREDDIIRLIEMDPRAAMSQLLADPSGSYRLCEMMALEWARRDPDAAIRFFESQKSFRGQDCLYQVLAVAYPSDPARIARIFRSQSRYWQERHLEDFFSKTWSVRAPGAPPEIESDDPFFRDDHWVEVRPGEEMLACLADDRLRELARGYMEPDPPASVVPETTEPKELDLAGFVEDDWNSVELLREQLKNDREKTIEILAESGNYQARSKLMWLLVGDFSMDSKDWPAELAKVEAWMDRLGVVPEYPPSHFEMGPFLRGEEAADWIARQPVALQRAWAPTFVETWVVGEPQMAVDWALTLPEVAGRDRAFQTGMVVWAHKDPRAAAEHIATLPAGELRESAISNTAASWSCTDRAGAKAWLESLPDGSGKERGLQRVK